MAKLTDPAVLEMVFEALRNRKCDGYVHWEPGAKQELARDCQLTPEAVNAALASAYDGGRAPDIETQKGGPYDGEDRFVYRIKAAGIPVYVKFNVYRDHQGEPQLDVVRCHRGWR